MPFLSVDGSEHLNENLRIQSTETELVTCCTYGENNGTQGHVYCLLEALIYAKS
jgi:hypothetical protein